MARSAGALALLVLALGSPSWATYAVRISDLGNSPLPPNPIRVWGRVTSTSPMRLSDGRAEIDVIGLAALIGDFVVVTGTWDGAALTVTQTDSAFLGPARTEMVYVPAGSFLMGNNGSEGYSQPDELPQHSVYLSGYWIGRYEVTRGEYRQFMDAGGYSNSSYWSSDGWNWKVSNGRTEPSYWAAQQNWGSPPGTFTQTDDHPVVGVAHYEVEAFCNWAGGHLATEAQWEKAARWTGSYPNVYPWGNAWDQQKSNNLYDTLYPKYQTAPVGSYPSGTSPYGCQDMAGNVWEWCKDRYASSYYSYPPPGGWIDPQGPSSGSARVLRGGSWIDSDSLQRCSNRNAASHPFDCYFYLGFRLAR